MQALSKKEIHENNLKNIEDAAIDLLEHVHYDNITVTDICNKANISRQTFYKNYSGVDDVISSYIQSVFDQIFQTTVTMIGARNGAEFYRPIFEKVRDRQDFFKIIFSENESMMFRLFLMYADKIDDPHIHFKKYEREFYVGAFFAIIRQWVLNDCKEPIDELVDFIFSKA